MINWIKKHKKKMIGALLLFFSGCLLTFVCVTMVTVQAGEVQGTTEQEETTAALATDPLAGLEGNLGGLSFQINGDGTGSLSSTLQILLILTIIALAPSILIMLTSFTRIVIILHFVRAALGTQTTPPNQVMIGLALFLTFFIMAPVFNTINTDALQPLSRGEISTEAAFEKGLAPIRNFMFGQMKNEKDLKLFIDIAGIEVVNGPQDIPTSVLIPAFIISELRAAFIIGFIIYIPFIVIDMVVASTLMSMGMMMLPPTTISMPFKILLFVILDGWNLVIGSVVKTFY